MHRKSVKLFKESDYAIEIEVELTEDEEGWSPYLASGEVEKLDKIRRDLALGDLKTAASTSMAKVYRLHQLS